VSFYGDNHPWFAGSVVKAMASAQKAYPHVVKLFDKHVARLGEEPQASRDARRKSLFDKLDDEWRPRVERVERLTPTIVEVVVRAPAAARRFHPGQFYRLQNFEVHAPIVEGTRLAMEGIALTGAWVDKAEGLLSLIALEMGTSSRLLATLKPGQPVVVMGPTGAPTEIPHQETVLLAGGGLGNAVLFSIAKALQDKGARVIYFAGYKKGEDLFKQDDIEAATDQVIWCTDTGIEVSPRRRQDRHFRGKHRASHGGLCEARAGRRALPAARRVAHHRHRLGPHDERGARGATWGARPLPRSETHRHWQHQLPHAVHDEGGLCAVPPASRGPGDWQGDDRLHLHEPGPGAGSRGLQEPRGAPPGQHSQEKLANAWLDRLFAAAPDLPRV
jgi:NAD(P)H-flavin reductase